MAPFSKVVCFGGSSRQKDDPNSKRHREIEKQLREDQKRMQREVKLLLLGICMRCSNTLSPVLIQLQEPESRASLQY